MTQCRSCQSDLPVLADGKKGGYCVTCGIPFTVAESGAHVFDEGALDKLAEKVADEIEARTEAKRKARKKKLDDEDPDAEAAERERKRKEKEDEKYLQ